MDDRRRHRGLDGLVDPARLAVWMDAVGLAPGAPLHVERITTGHSNEVFSVRRAELDLVLRRPPRTPLSPTAHDVAREHRVIAAVRRSGSVPVPEPVALCTDPEVIGAPFCLMRRLDGVVVRERLPAGLRGDDGVPAAFGGMLVDVLADLHGTDWRAVGLEGFGRPDGYLERQVPRWIGQLERYRTRPLPEVDEAARWLADHLPPPRPPAIIHGDYKLDNVMVADRLPVSPVAVLDWEQSTIGDPLVDLGWLLGTWVEPGEDAPFGGTNLALAGHGPMPTRDELAERYAARAGADLTHLRFYCVLALFKLACVMEGSYARYRAGTADDPLFALLEEGVPALARRALTFT